MRSTGRLAGPLLLLVALLAFTAEAGAAARFARTSGNWTAITWGTSCGAGNVADPVAADDVTICNGVTVTVNTSPTVASISMPAGGTNTILQITSSQTLTVSGDVTMVAGTGSGDHRQLLLSNGASLVVSGSVSLSGNGNDNRYALLQITGSNATIGGNLVIDGVATGTDRARVIMANMSNLIVGGSITLDVAGELDNGNNGSVIQLGGNFTHVDATGNYTSSGGEFRFTGTGAQALNGGTGVTTTFSRLTVNKPSGDVTINHVAQVANGGTLTLTSGRIVTGASYVGVGVSASATISGANTDSYIVGNLRRYIPTGTQSGILFPVGGSTASKFAPVQIDFPNVTTAGTFQVASATGDTDHPNIATSAIDASLSVNRYWTLTNSGSINYAATGAAITFNYPASDVDGGATTSDFFIGNYNGSDWAYPTTGTLGATSSQVTGVLVAAIAGDYAIGEMGGPYSYWPMNENSWNGTANEAGDFGSGSNAGTATTLTGALPNTANTSPAIAGSPGTCRYGVFTRANKNYLALPTGYPALMAAGQPGFSITAWINSTNTALPGQRIMIDDQNNTAPGGWGFSLGETDRAGAGGVRFFYRQAATVTIDTVAVPSNQWLFVALSVSLAAGTNASVGTIYVYNTAGTLVTSYTQNFTWTAGSDPGPPSIGGETNASGEGNNAFGFSGNIDELRVYRAPLSQAMVNRVRQLVNPCEVTDHYAITGSATGVTCDASTVQFTAHNAAHAAVSPSAGTILTLSTSTGTGVWQAGTVAGTGTWAPSGANNGSATYTWPGGESTFSVRLRHNTTATVNINVLDANGKAESGTEDLSIAFANAAIRVTADGTTSANIGTQLSAKNSNTGFGAQTLYLQAIRTDTNTGSCVGVFQSQTVTVEMAAARVNPTGSTSQVSVMNSSSAMVALGTGAGAAGTYTNVSLAFDAQSKAPLVLNYPNAGSVSLFARYQLPAPPAGTYITGTSNTFVVRPFGLRISGPPSGVTGSGGTGYARAGATWPQAITVTAVQWVAGEDANNDGIPDSEAVLAGNAPTTNFGAETAPATATVTHTLAEPSGGNSGALSATLSVFSNGVATASATFSEVGIINLFAASTNYMGTSQNVTNSAAGYAGVGRFYPDHFFVATSPASSLTNRSALSCPTSTFTYMGENFALGFTLQARNTAGVITQNYTTASGFAKLVPATSAQLGLGARSGTTNLTSRLTPVSSSGTFTAGSSTIAATLVLNRNAAVDGPYAATGVGIAPADSDGVTLLTASMNLDVDNNAANDHQAVGATTNFRFGRLRLQSANGSERLVLRVPVEAQYWNGNGFVVNGADSCTPLAANNVALGNYQGNLATGETTVSVAAAISGGAGALQFSAPGSGNNGSVDLSYNLGTTTAGASCLTGMGTSTPSNRAWLQGAWCGALYDDDPSARATFGVYKASDRVIYLRENY